MKFTKKQAEKLNSEIREILADFEQNADGKIITDYGPLYVHPSNDAGSEVATVFCRFEDVEKAREIPCPIKPNPYTGKWNFHVWAHEAEFLPGMVETQLRKLVG